LMMVSKTPQAPVALPTTDGITGVATDGGAVYWTDNIAKQVARFAPGDAMPTVLVEKDNMGPYGVVVHGSTVYFGTVDGVMKSVPAAGGMATKTVASGALRNFAVDDDFIYWANLVENRIMKVEPKGMTPIPLTGQIEGLEYVAIDEAFVYFTSDDGRIRKIA